MVRPANRCVFWMLRSTLRCPGVRKSDNVRGALPNVNGAAAVKAAGLIQLVSRLSSEPLVARSTPGTMLGRCELPSSPELLADCQTLTGKPFWKRAAIVSD